MRDLIVYALIIFKFNVITTHGYNVSSTNMTFNETFTDKNNSSANIEDLSSICKSKICIAKCCPENTYVISRKRVKSCISYNAEFNFDFSTLNISSHKNKSKVLSTLGDKNYVHLVPNKFSNETFKTFSSNGAGFTSYKTFLTDDAVFHLESANMYDRWISFKEEQFCVDYQLSSKNKTPVARVFVAITQKKVSKNLFLPIALTVSAFFLLVVLVVYSLLPELRNLCGMILMAYVFSLFGAFLLLAIIQFRRFQISVCVGLTLVTYFFFLSSFCWMNVMSFDIWWTFRGYAKARAIHRRGEHFKFLMYCLYAYGVPIMMTIFTWVMNTIDLSDTPWIVKPNIGSKGCFIGGGEKLLYLYTPMFFLIICNWLLFLMTAYNVWRLSRGTGLLNSAAAGNSSAHRTDKHRFMIYIKLSVVMGLNWLLEIVSFLFYPNLGVWKFTDAYNMFMGFFIFLIFVCKVKIFKKLKKRCRGYQTQWSPSTRSNSITTSDSASTQDASLPVICINPKGPAYQIKST